MTNPFCSSCKLHKDEKEFRDKLNRIMKTCHRCRTVKKPPVGAIKDSPVKPPPEVIALNRMWPAPQSHSSENASPD